MCAGRPTRNTRGRLALRVLALLVLTGCRDWREHVDSSRAASEPEQAAIAGEPPIELDLKGYRIRLTPRATYKVTGYAAETSRKLLDKWDFVVPLDLALVWGPVADPAVVRIEQVLTVLGSIAPATLFRDQARLQQLGHDEPSCPHRRDGHVDARVIT